MKRWQLHTALLLTALVLSVGSAWAQGSQARVTLDTTNITLGEQITVQFEVITPKGSAIKWPEMESVFPMPLELVEASEIDTFYDPKAGDIQVMTQNVVITAFDTGFVAVPPIPFPHNETAALTDAFLVSVFDVIVEGELELNDIKGPLDVPFSWWEWFKENWYWVLGGLLLAGGIIWLFVYLLRQKPEQVSVVFTKPVDPPHEIALRALEALKAEQLWQQGKVKQFHTELSDIFRSYLEKRFNIPALEQTSDEIIRSLRTVPIAKSLKAQLQEILMLTDLVKFAKEQPLPAENELAFDNIHQFVRDTRPADAPLPAQNSNPQSQQT